VAVKLAVPNVLSFARIVQQYGDAVTVVCGLAEQWAPFCWMGGGRGFTSGLVNVAPALSLAMLDALERGDNDEAMRVWRQIAPFEELRARHSNANNVPVVKEAMSLLGLLENPSVRPPLAALSREDKGTLRQLLDAWPAGALAATASSLS
jgi:4-hydroxy-tetrahydrodipicolinate synthase